MSKDERVLCFPSSRLDDIGRWQGYNQSTHLIPQIFHNDKTKFEFLPRHQIEDNPSYKQIIPYTIVQYVNKDDILIFSYTRGKSGGEERLKKLKSIGIGGHVSESVKSNRKNIEIHHGPSRSCELTYVKLEGMREINEEIKYKQNNPLMYLCGMINDDSDPVGRVHLGLVYLLLVNNSDIVGNEECIHDYEMVKPETLKQHINEYESWSKLLIDAIGKKK